MSVCSQGYGQPTRFGTLTQKPIGSHIKVHSMRFSTKNKKTMKRDNLEQFIIHNRKELDTAIPSLNVWAELDKKLPVQMEAKRISIQRFLSMAAAIVLLLGFGAGIGFYLSPSNHEGLALKDISPKYAETEQYYKKQVSENLAKLASYQATSPDIQKDLQELDAWMKELQKELSIVPKNKEETVINEIIDLYKTKIAILEKVLESIQSSNQKNNIQNETMDI